NARRVHVEQDFLAARGHRSRLAIQRVALQDLARLLQRSREVAHGKAVVHLATGWQVLPRGRGRGSFAGQAPRRRPRAWRQAQATRRWFLEEILQRALAGELIHVAQIQLELVGWRRRGDLAGNGELKAGGRGEAASRAAQGEQLGRFVDDVEGWSIEDIVVFGRGIGWRWVRHHVAAGRGRQGLGFARWRRGDAL